MNDFKLPRKLKKKLKKGFWLYPPDEKGNSLMANPYRDKKDYEAYVNGELQNLFTEVTSTERLADRQKMNAPIEVSEEILREYVKEIFAKEYRNSSYQVLLDAKKFRDTKVAYFNFLNAYKQVKEGDDSMGNICCAAVDYAKNLLQIRKNRRKNRKKSR